MYLARTQPFAAHKPTILAAVRPATRPATRSAARSHIRPAYSRSSARSFASSDCLKPSELRSLAQNRRIRLTCEEDEIYLVVFPDTWHVSDDVWCQMADIINELDVAEVLRKEIASYVSYPSEQPMFLALGVRKVHDDQTAFDDWIDHA